ncbi:MAG: hypothetical protein NVSMB30_19950 [Hymenobacter sp.]
MSHDPADTLPWADEMLVLRRGCLVQQGRPEQVYQQPVDEYTAALFGDYNLVRGVDRQALLPTSRRKAAANTLLVRPESFRLGGAPASGGLTGNINAVRYFGSYYELEIALPENVIRVRTTQNGYRAGTAVQVAVASGQGRDLALPRR